MVTGQFVDPRSGRVTFREYAESWRAGQVHPMTTVAYIEGKLHRHAYPVGVQRLTRGRMTEPRLNRLNRAADTANPSTANSNAA